MDIGITTMMMFLRYRVDIKKEWMLFISVYLQENKRMI